MKKSDKNMMYDYLFKELSAHLPSGRSNANVSGKIIILIHDVYNTEVDPEGGLGGLPTHIFFRVKCGP